MFSRQVAVGIANARLWDGIEKSDPDEVRDALCRGADVNDTMGHGGRYMLMKIIGILAHHHEGGSLKMSALRYAAGVDVEKKTYRSSAVLRTLVDAGAKDSPGDCMHSAIELACLFGSCRTVHTLLINKGTCDLNAHYPGGVPPLMTALTSGLGRERDRLAIVRDLLNSGASTEALYRHHEALGSGARMPRTGTQESSAAQLIDWYSWRNR